MSLFQNQCYKSYLNQALARGMKTKLAAALRCNIGFISQVISGSSNFSQEHSLGTSIFLNHSEAERDYFMLLVLKEKAGTHALKEYYQKKIDQLNKDQQDIKNKIVKNKQIDPVDESRYFSSSTYALIHMALSLPNINTVSDLIEVFKLNPEAVNEVLSFLIKESFVIQKDNKLTTGPTRIHLGRESSLINQHHINTRVEAIRSISNQKESDLHYSGFITLSEKDAVSVKNKILNLIQDTESLLKDSENETLYLYAIDFANILEK